MATEPAVRVARWTLRSGLILSLLSGAAAVKPSAAAPSSARTIRSLVVTPKKIALRGPYAEARVLIEGRTGAGETQDVSARAALTVADTRVAVIDEHGTVRARGDGDTVLIVRLTKGVAPQAREARIPIEVRGVAKAGPPRFLVDVVPVLTRAGCNMGACHGAASGKGGFKLSLQGYDPESDYVTITRQAGARRIARTQPERSLLLRKPTLGVAHRGGLRFRVDSPEYRLLRDWIAGGMPGPAPDEPSVKRLEVIPRTRTLARGQTQRFIVRAHYSDGSARDVTGQTLFTASDETVATVTPGGEAKAVGPGEGAVLIRYENLVATARVISPFGPPRTTGVQAFRRSGAPPPQSPPSPGGGREGGLNTRTTEHPIDRLVNQKLAALGLDVSPRCSDSDFLRRAYLDVIGLLPTPEEARAFLASRDPKKREKLIDSLLERSEYVDFWSLKWGDLLRNTRRTLSERGMYAFNHWLRQSVKENKPWDQFARELLLAGGSTYAGPAVFYRTATTPETLAETTSQVFLGVRIQCARCHNHPYEKWTQNQYYQMAAFFARVKAKQGPGQAERIIYTARTGEVVHPKSRKEVTPCALDATPIPADYRGDRREALAKWLTSPQNPFFARILVNRVWRHFLGRGLVEPVDDVRVTNPPSNEALLDFLAKDFVNHHYDLKYLMRAIMRSETYQRAAEPTGNNAQDARYYSRYLFKRLSAEQLMDALAQATGVPEKFNGYPLGTRASQLPDTTVPSYFLELFGRPARNITCECERADEPNLGQVLHLMNNAGLNARLAAKEGRVASLLEAKQPDSRIVEELYLAALARFPTPEERRQSARALAAWTKPKVWWIPSVPKRRQAAEDLLWALLNSKEFVFNH